MGVIVRDSHGYLWI